jgi:hypothetical protein
LSSFRLKSKDSGHTGVNPEHGKSRGSRFRWFTF